MENNRKNKLICILFALFFAFGFFLCVLLPKKEYSYSERRKLAQLPKCSKETLWNGTFMSGFDKYSQDQFPFREDFRRLKALTATKVFGRKDNHGIYVTDGFAAAMEYPMKEKHMEQAAQRFRYLYETYLTEENSVFFSVIPDKNCFLAEESGHLSMDYDAFEKTMAKKMDFAEYIQISDLLDRNDYYKTDTHWRQEQITNVADRLASAMGTTSIQDYEKKTVEQDFYGVYAGQSALPLKPDSLCYLTNDTLEQCKVYDYQNNRPGFVYDFQRASGKDPYELFLTGPISLITMENPTAKNSRELILFRDSFGSSIAPLLLDGYSKITLVDIRYIHPDLLGKFVDFRGCDVLFLYSSLVLNTFSF